MCTCAPSFGEMGWWPRFGLDLLHEPEAQSNCVTAGFPPETTLRGHHSSEWVPEVIQARCHGQALGEYLGSAQRLGPPGTQVTESRLLFKGSHEID